MHIQIPYTGTKREEFLKNLGYFASLFVVALSISYMKSCTSQKEPQQHLSIETRSSIEGKSYPLSINGDSFDDLVVRRNNEYTVYPGKEDGIFDESIPLSIEKQPLLEERVKNMK